MAARNRRHQHARGQSRLSMPVAMATTMMLGALVVAVIVGGKGAAGFRDPRRAGSGGTIASSSSDAGRERPILREVDVAYRQVAASGNATYYFRVPPHSAPWLQPRTAHHGDGRQQKRDTGSPMSSAHGGGGGGGGVTVANVVDGSNDIHGRRLRRELLQTQASPTSPAPIRIHTDIQLPGSLSSAARDEIERVVVPQVLARLRGLLSVLRPVDGRLVIQRFCSSYFTWSDGTVECAAVSPVGSCGSADERPWYFADYTLCTGNSIGDCTLYSSSGSQVAGVADTDFILYVTADPSSCAEDTVGTGAFCNLDEVTYRPLSGFLNLCPDSVLANANTANNVTTIATGFHEVIHGLFFHDELYNYYIDSNSIDPLTGKHVRLGSENVVKTVESRDKSVQVIATPAVVAHTRQLTGCPTLEGAEIENEGGDGTGNTHWESRLFLNEIMTGVTGDSAEVKGNYQAITNLTLALAKDSGWYDVDFSLGQSLPFVQDRGCAFATSSCSNPASASYAMIAGRGKIFCTLSNYETCSWDHTRRAECYVNPTLSHGVLLDGCEVPLPYGGIGACGDASQQDGYASFTGQRYSSSSFCFDRGSAAVVKRINCEQGCSYYGNIIDETSTTKDVQLSQGSDAGCYSTRCDTGRLFVSIDGVESECVAGGSVAYPASSGFVSGSILCPDDPASICSQTGCPDNCSNRGHCFEGVCDCHPGYAVRDSSTLSEDSDARTQHLERVWTHITHSSTNYACGCLTELSCACVSSICLAHLTYVKHIVILPGRKLQQARVCDWAVCVCRWRCVQLYDGLVRVEWSFASATVVTTAFSAAIASAFSTSHKPNSRPSTRTPVDTNTQIRTRTEEEPDTNALSST